MITKGRRPDPGPLVLALALVLGCGDASPSPVLSLQSQYAMTEVNDVTVPCFLSVPAPFHFKLLGGRLKFGSYGSNRWSGLWHLERWEGGGGPLCPSGRAPTVDAGAGPYLLAAGDILDETQASVTLVADSVWLSQDDPATCGVFGCLRTSLVRGGFQFKAVLAGDGLLVTDGVVAEMERYRANEP